MTHTPSSSLLPLALVLMSSLAWGQDDDPGPLSAEVERRLAEQDARIKKLEQQLEATKAKPAAPASRPAAEAQDAEAEEAEDDKVELGLFYIRSKSGDHELNLHARIMLDGKFDLAHDFFDNTFQVRRARLTIEGKVFKYIGYKLGLEFGRTSDADVRDAYIQFAFLDEAQIWGGQMLLPFSTERLTSSNYMKHPERPIAVASLVGNREIGFQFYGEALDDQITYWVGIYNGDEQNVRVDSDDDKDVATRFEFRPIKGLQLSASYIFTPVNRGSEGPADVSTVGNAATKFLDFDQANNRRLGKRHRLNGGARFRFGPVEVKGEVFADYQMELRTSANAGGKRNLLMLSWFVDAAVLLTGEQSRDVIEPERPFYGPEGFGTGAFELAFRYEDYRADPRSLRNGFATGTDKVQSGTITLTWIPIKRMRWMVSYTGSSFDDPLTDRHGRRHKNDHAAFLRMHFFF